jgi:hypothetical protein
MVQMGDIGLAMTAKIMKENGQITYLSSHRCLTDLKYQDPLVTKQREAFTIALLEKIGGPIDPGDLAQLDPSAATPENELYKDDGDARNARRVCRRPGQPAVPRDH